MPRAKAVFEKEDFNVIEAPMGFYQKQPSLLLIFIPVVRVSSEQGGFGMKY
jgi:uncharacterized SAM-binding protein YcdF (DUF218 family)